MRKKIALVLVAMMTLGFTACGDKKDESNNNGSTAAPTETVKEKDENKKLQEALDRLKGED